MSEPAGSAVSAAIVLAGGRSSRMGSPKPMLEWHGSTLMRRAAGLVARVVDGPVVVVCARGQDPGPLPDRVEVAEDERPDRGPLQGIAAGAATIGARAQIVFVTGVDTPLLHPALVAHVLRSLRNGDDAALPRTDGTQHPLTAAYRVGPLVATLEEQLAADRLAARGLVARLRVRELDEAALLADPAVAALDPELDSLRNLNSPADYRAARARPAPRITVDVGTAAGPRALRAATLGQAAAGANVSLAPPTVAILDGHGPLADAGDPLAAGDRLIFVTRR